ncbi:MAG: TraM recognition domain-containing protein [Phycisphaerales bacterium]|nr:TraM recognition domain-containing protein [Phycisphaerales bacterium]
MAPHRDKRTTQPRPVKGRPVRQRGPGIAGWNALREAQRMYLLLALGVPSFVLFCIVARSVSLSFAVTVTCGISVFTALRAVRLGHEPASALVKYPLAWLAILLAAYGLGILLRSRLYSTIPLAVVTLIAFLFCGRWISEAVADLRTPALPIGGSVTRVPPRRPRLVSLIIVLLIVSIVPTAHSTTLAILAVIATCVGAILLEAAWANRTPWRSVWYARKWLNAARAAYLDDADPWVERGATRTANARRMTYLACMVPLTLTLAVSLSFCCPWEIFAQFWSSDFQWKITPDMNYHAYQWLTAPIWPRAHVTFLYWGNVIVGLGLLFLLPELILMAVYAPVLCQSNEQSQGPQDAKASQHRGQRDAERPDQSAAPSSQEPPPGAAKATTDAPTEKGASPSPVVDTPTWERESESVARSHVVLESDSTGRPCKIKAEHLFVGFNSEDDTPVLLDRDILHEHAYIVGQTGSGKTALGIIPLLVQLIRGHDVPKLDADRMWTGDWEPSKHAPIVILDLKGDPVLYNTARIEAECAGRTFLAFSADGRKATHCFDPFSNLNAEPRSCIEISELLVQALGLFHGEFYGASYYSRQHRDLLLTLTSEAQRAGKQITSWNQLYEFAKQRDGGRKYRDALELITVIHALTFYDQLALGSPRCRQPAIHMPTVIRERQIVYFWLPSALVNMSVREIAKLALYTLMTASADYHGQLDPNDEPIQTYVIIDEFQRIAAENLSVVLQQVRMSYIALIMANQDPNDLRLPNVDLRSTVMTNSRMRQYFTVTDSDIMEQLSTLSGEQIEYLYSDSVSFTKQKQVNYTSMGTGFGVSEGQKSDTGRSETITNRLRADDFIAINNDRQGSLLHIIRDGGLTALGGYPTRIYTPWFMDRAEYERRRRTPWPLSPQEGPSGQITPEQAPESIEQRRRELQAAIDPSLLDAIAEIKRDESGGATAPDATPPKKKKGRQRPTKSMREKRRAKPPEETGDAEDRSAERPEGTGENSEGTEERSDDATS